MNQLRKWCTFAVVCGSTGLAMGRAPLIDPPTPPPCAADGTCYPKTTEWGYYPSRWRTWPGAQLEPTPSKSPTEAGQVSPELSHSETPPAEVEDAAAPPTSPRREEPAEAPPTPPGAESGENGESTLPNVPLPDAETPPLGPGPESLGPPPLGPSPLGPTSEQDPPPALPRSLSARVPYSAARQATTAVSTRPAAPRVSTGDPPPSPPWAQSASL